MPRTSLDVRVPGKLMLLGEYAVLDPGADALVLAVNRFVRVRVEPAAAFALECPDIGIEGLGGRVSATGVQWSRDGEAVDATATLPFVDRALAIVIAMARAAGRELAPFRMRIASELGAGETKAGLGSSASVAVAVAAGALAWWDLDLAADAGRARLFQVAGLAHYLAQARRGSGADVAAAVTGGIVAYRNPGFDELLRGVPRTDESPAALAAILAERWERLRLEIVPWPAEHALVAASTREAASTTDLIGRVTALCGSAAEDYRALCSTLGALARDAIGARSAAALATAMTAHQRALERFDAAHGLGIVTPATRRLVAIAERLGVAAKISGAGGGDSVVALAPRERVTAVADAYRAAGAEICTVSQPVAGASVHLARAAEP